MKTSRLVVSILVACFLVIASSSTRADQTVDQKKQVCLDKCDREYQDCKDAGKHSIGECQQYQWDCKLACNN